MLARIRRKRPVDTAADKATVSNAALLASKEFTSGSERDYDLLEALQDAWSVDDGSASSVPVVYPAKLRELVLNEASNLILEAFKQLFACSDLPPRESDVASMMQLVRLVDSIALTRGRRYRSIIVPTPADC
jgi:hypothetical protein